MGQEKLHSNWYFIIGKKTQAGIVQLTDEGINVLKGKKLELSILWGDIQQVSKAFDKRDPVVKIVDAKGQEITLKPLVIGDSDLEPLVDQLSAAIESARGNA
jgi:hypothetical protein